MCSVEDGDYPYLPPGSTVHGFNYPWAPKRRKQRSDKGGTVMGTSRYQGVDKGKAKETARLIRTYRQLSHEPSSSGLGGRDIDVPGAFLALH